MAISQKELSAQIEAIVKDLNAQYATDGYVKGVLNNAPFLFKVLHDDPTLLLFKFRLASSRTGNSRWHTTFDSRLRALDITCETDEKYLWLWLRKATGVDGALIAQIVRQCVDYHSDYFPATSTHCFICDTTRPVSLVQDEDSIITVCDECMAKASEKRALAEKSLNPTNVLLGTMIPLGLVVSATGGAVFWFLYELLFEVAGVDVIYVPEIVLGGVVILVAFGLGWPVGKLLLRSGVTKRIPRTIVSTLATIIMVVCGELLFAAIIVFRSIHTLDMPATIQVSLHLLTNTDFTYLLYKLAFAVFLGAMIYGMLEPKKVKLAL